MANKTIVFSVLAGLIIFAAVLLVSGLENIKNILFHLSVLEFLVIFLIFSIDFFIIVYRWKIVLESYGYKVPYKRLIAPKASCFAVSYLTPFSRIGGEPVRAYMLKKRNKVPFIIGLASTISDKIIEFSSSLLIVLLGIFIIFIKYSISKRIGVIMLSIAGLFVLLLLIFYFTIMNNKKLFTTLIKMFGLNKIKHLDGIEKHTIKFEGSISNFFINHKKRILLLILLSTLANLFILVNYIVAASFLGQPISFAESILIFSLTALATTFPIPGALGPYEGFSALVFSLIGAGAGFGVAFSLVTRGVELIIVALGIFFVYHFGIKMAINTLLGKNAKNN